MKKYRKKPIVVEAEQWFKPGDLEGIVVPKLEYANRVCKRCGLVREHGWVETLEGGHIVCPGDWIVRGVKGEFYPVKPDIFKETYEEINDRDGGEE